MTAATPDQNRAPASRAQAHHAFARSDRSAIGVWWWTVDRWMLGVVALLIAVGVVIAFAASPAAAARMNIGDPFHFAVRQCVFAAAAAAILVVTSMFDVKTVKRSAFFIWLIAIAVMVALPFLGHNAKGATRWIELGGFSLQPSEFMKPALIVLVAWMFSEGQKGQGVPGVSIAFALYLIPVALLLMQPDVGQTVLITATFGAVFWMAGVPLSWVMGLGVVAVAGLGSTYFLLPHVASRVDKFLQPDKADTHQVDAARVAQAAGRLFGRGPGEGVLKRSIPDAHTDFALSVGAEEFGLVFLMLVVTLFTIIVVRGLYRAMKLSDPFEQVAAAGLFVLVGLQAIINVAVNLDMIPTKGMTLPFISYGGSSMLAMGLTLGLALALTRRRPGAYTVGEGLAKAGAFA
ncbi:putative lipid II flippase FtsW [Phenylobacterium sp.]|uniref:putative lipid II flippase FtsW n=1 Tax=Phenylobacterium sp. TaxID=1871053 RepID=UPI00121F0243|nr:putative lipid II flippase FtsW [Phenylobacterium sp.]THD61447.1 MAG: putative lipid II flippase FtsW [Phenylobacterium sp.]